MLIIDGSEDDCDILELLKKVRRLEFSHCSLRFLCSGLIDKYRSKYQIRIAVNTISDVLGDDSNSFIYISPNLDIFLIFDISDKERVSRLVFQLKHLFLDDHTVSDNQEVNSSFCVVYDLGLQWDIFVSDITSISCSSNELNNIDSSLFNEKKSNLVLANALQIESSIKSINLLKHLSIKTCYIVKQDNWNELFDIISIDYNKLLITLDLQIIFDESSYLYRYLDEQISKKLFRDIMSSTNFMRPVNIKLSVNVIMSTFFINMMEKNLSKINPLSLLIDIDIIDVFENKNVILDVFKRLEKYNVNHVIKFRSTPVFFEGIEDAQFFKIPAILSDIDYTIDMSDDVMEKLIRHRTIVYDSDTDQNTKPFMDCGFVLFSGMYVSKLANQSVVSRYTKSRPQ